MRNQIFYYFVVLVVLSSCEKIEIQSVPNVDATAKTEQPSSTLKQITTPNVAQPLYSKFDLQSQGNGVYSGLATDQNGSLHSITVDGIFYKTIDDFGNPIPVRDGDPIYGTIHVSYSDGGSSVGVQPNGSILQNHFSVQYGVLSGGNGAPDLAKYNSDYTDSLNNYNHAYSIWYTAYQNGITMIEPQWNSPFIIKYLTTSYGGAKSETFTGKLIRSNTGTTTFAVATENYPVPAPLAPPPQQYNVGYWLSGSTEVFVFVSSSNGSLIVKGSLNTYNSTLYTASGTFDAATGMVTNFHMVANGITYDNAGPISLLGAP